MTRLLIIVVALAACVDQGKAGPKGAPGPAGPMGADGEHLVWKDAGGTTVPNSFASHTGTSFDMVVADANGVFFGYGPLDGGARYEIYNSSSLYHYWLSNDCTGPARVPISTAPGVAFKWDGRIVAMPNDIDAAATVGSIYYSGSCRSPGTGPYGYVEVAALDALPTIQPPLIGPGPYHVERE
jgi:hypothetical protein